MPETCCAYGCTNRRKKGSVISFYRFPVNKQKREQWIAAIKRKQWKPGKYGRVCSAHFISGKKSTDPLSPDYVPSVFAHISSPQKKKAARALASYRRRKGTRKRRLDQQAKQDAAQILVDIGSSTKPANLPNTEVPGIEIQTDITLQDMDNFDMVVKECQLLRTENITLKDTLALKGGKFDLSIVRSDDNRTKQLTGLSSYSVLKELFEEVRPFLKDKSLTAEQQFMMFVMRLRFGLTHTFMAFIYGVHASTISRLFLEVLNVAHERLVPPLLFWPEKDIIRKTLPMCFRDNNYRNCTSIIDCFEIFIERPSDLKARAQTYSNYKNTNTVKYLISITPQGFISFISTGWGGRTSDKHLTENSGYLGNLLPTDVVLADRGFKIAESVALYGASLDIPAFTKGQKQLHPVEVEKTRTIANIRIHVERVIGMLRQKYAILENRMPITFLHTYGHFTTLDRIVRVACALCNTAVSMVPFE